MTRIFDIAILALTASVAVAQYGAIPELDERLRPRLFLGSQPQLIKRQAGVCPSANSHQCLDINQSSLCCDNNHYCAINNDGSPICCSVALSCNTLCAISQYQCPQTITVSGTATTTASCCPRPCAATASFKCPAEFGGGCCALGYACTSGASSCVLTATPITTLASQVPTGCSSGQFSCAASIGGGCCNNGAVCTSQGTSLFCAAGASSAVRTGPGISTSTSLTVTPSGGDGLSTGAKAGIGAGIAVVACLVLGFLIWFWVKRRRAAQKTPTGSETLSASGDMSQNGRVSRPWRSTRTSDGPDAVPGPFTEDALGTTSGLAPVRGVPVSPDNPADIVPVVEIGHSREHSNVTSPGENISNVTSPGDFGMRGEYFGIKKVETTEEVFELP